MKRKKTLSFRERLEKIKLIQALRSQLEKQQKRFQALKDKLESVLRERHPFQKGAILDE